MLRGRACARGVSLIELLVALLVTSVGLLTFAALQVASQSYVQETHRRVLADLLAQDFMERMRANTLSAADLSLYELTASFEAQAQIQPAALPRVACAASDSACSIENMARFDLRELRMRVRELLPPEGALFAARAASDPDRRTLDLWIAWREPPMRAASWVARAANECPAGLNVAAEPSVRCLSWRVRR